MANRNQISLWGKGQGLIWLTFSYPEYPALTKVKQMYIYDDCSIFFRNTPTISQIAKVYKINESAISILVKLSNDLADHYIDKFGDSSISKEGLSKAMTINMLDHGIHYTVTKLDKLKTNERSKFYYKNKMPHYSLLNSGVKATAEGRKERF